MSDDREAVRLAKWPFYLADVLLCGVVFFVLYQLGTFEGTSDLVIVSICLGVVAIAAWFSVMPWLKEHEARVKVADSTNLKTSLEQIKGVEKVAELIRQSNGQWQAIQDTSARTLASAHEITDRMKFEADEFMKFMAQAQDQERTGLRLEVEKLRRMEGDWIKVAVGMLDHTYAVFRAAERSGQQGLIAQLGQFQNACREVARRMGLAPFVPVVGENFDARTHQLADPKAEVPEGAKLQEALACGYTYQGQLLRRALVVAAAEEQEQPPSPAPETPTEFRSTMEGHREVPVFADQVTEDVPEAPASIAADELDENSPPVPEAEVFEDLSSLESVTEEDVSKEESTEAQPQTGAAPQAPKPRPQDELPF
jgi:molecular chaperone GrpE (heat shock protein)